jgi:hypothetical protein
MIEGNQNFERVLDEKSQLILVIPFPGKSTQNYSFY